MSFWWSRNRLRWRRCSASKSVRSVSRLHRAKGVDVRCDVGVAEVRGTGHVEQVVLSDGTELDADLVVVGIGSSPGYRVAARPAASSWTTAWSVMMQAAPAHRMYGPSAMSHHGVSPVGHQVRVEHWSNVADQARVMVPAILGTEIPPTVTVPYFWSDQYDVKIQCLGEPQADDTVHIVEDDGRKFLAFDHGDGVVAGVVGGGMPGKVMKVRTKIANGAPIADVLG